MTRLAFLWSGLPDYAARQIRAVVDRGHRVDVIATRPRVPIEGMERSLGQPVRWIEPDESPSFEALGLGAPEVLFQGGYFVRAFNALARQARAVGAPVVLMADNNWDGTLRQRFVDPLRHRLLLVSRFDGVLVPGHSGHRFAAAMGYRADRILTGLYGADPTIFYDGAPLAERDRRILFVGQLNARKNVLPLAHAFAAIADRFPAWELQIAGTGPLEASLPDHPQVRRLGFVQPERLGALLRSARCLALPSLSEHWGLVVHEAALSGCALLLADGIGAADDFCDHANAVRFDPKDARAMRTALERIMGFDASDWRRAQTASLARARAFGPKRFADAVETMVGLVASNARDWADRVEAAE